MQNPSVLVTRTSEGGGGFTGGKKKRKKKDDHESVVKMKTLRMGRGVKFPHDERKFINSYSFWFNLFIIRQVARGFAGKQVFILQQNGKLLPEI